MFVSVFLPGQIVSLFKVVLTKNQRKTTFVGQRKFFFAKALPGTVLQKEPSTYETVMQNVMSSSDF